MWRHLFGLCHRLFHVMTFNAVNGTRPLDIVIFARMTQVTESHFAERRLFREDYRVWLRCWLLLARNVTKAPISFSCGALRSNTEIRDQNCRRYRGNQAIEFHVSSSMLISRCKTESLNQWEHRILARIWRSECGQSFRFSCSPFRHHPLSY